MWWNFSDANLQSCRTAHLVRSLALYKLKTTCAQAARESSTKQRMQLLTTAGHRGNQAIWDDRGFRVNLQI